MIHRLFIFVAIFALPTSLLAQGKPKVFTGPKGSVWGVALSHDGTLLAAASDVSENKKNDQGMDVTRIKGSEIRVWDVAKGEERKLFTHTMQFGDLAFSPDAKLVAAGTFKEIRLYDLGSGQVKQTLKDFEGSAKHLTFSADGKTLFSTNAWFGKAEIRLWNVAEGKLLKTLTDSGKVEFTGLGVSSDGKTLATSARLTEGGFSGQVKIWDVASGTAKQTIVEPKNWINSVALSPDGKLVAAPTQFTISIWDAQTGKLQRSVKEFVSSLEFLPGGTTLTGYINSGDGTDVKFIDAKTGRVKQTVKVKQKGLAHCGISPDGKWLACGSGDAGTGEVQVIDISRIK
jgi:WD40 repeat protein